MSVEKSGGVPLQMLKDDSARTATTSSGDSFGPAVIYGKWSFTAGRLSKLAETIPGILLISFMK